MKSLVVFFLVVATHQVNAADFFLINEKLPETIKHFSDLNQLPENNHAYKTPLGVTSRCYKGIHYLIISENELGNGYEFTKIAPENSTCTLLTETQKPLTNEAGMHLDMLKKEVLELLKVAEPTDAATLLYNQEIIVDNKKVDEQTWVDIEFTANKLNLLKVFVSLTE